MGPSPVLEGAPTLFHRVAELRDGHQALFRAAAEAGKAVASALPSRRRDQGCCSDPVLASSATMNPAIPRLVGALSNRRSLSFSFEEAARVESLCNGMLAAQSSGFWFFSALLRWLKELGFEAPDQFLFGQLVQEVSGPLVTAANSASGLAAFMIAKRREGVLSHFTPHVGAHFKKDLASSSFSGPHVLDDDVLARVIATSRVVSHLDAQLSIARAITLPVFRADMKNPGRKASSGQDSSVSSASSSGFRGSGRGSDSGVKAKGFFSGSLPQQEVSSSWLFPCFQTGKRSQVMPGTLSSSDRRLSVPPVVRLEEGQRCGALGGVSLEGGVCNSLSHASSVLTPIILDLYSPQSVKGRALEEEIQALRCKGVVEPAPSTPGFYSRLFVVTKATGGLAADYRPVHPEPECGLDSFSDGDISDGSLFCAEERLDGIHRSEGCLPSDSDPSCVSQVSQIRSRREDLAVPGPLLWSVHSPTGLHSRDGSCVGVPPSARSSDASVSRRLADSCVVSGGNLLGKGSGFQPLSGAGNCGQPGEVDPYSISSDYLLGNQDRLADFPGFGDSLEDRKVLLNSRRISVLKGAVCEVLEGLARPPFLPVSSCSEWSVSNESFTIGSKSRL